MAAALALAVTGIGGAWPLVGTLALFFVSFGLIVSNATTLALEPHGAAAGSAAAALGFIQTVVPALIASCIAVLYDGTAVPMIGAMLVLSALGWLITARRKADRTGVGVSSYAARPLANGRTVTVLPVAAR